MSSKGIYLQFTFLMVFLSSAAWAASSNRAIPANPPTTSSEFNVNDVKCPVDGQRKRNRLPQPGAICEKMLSAYKAFLGVRDRLARTAGYDEKTAARVQKKKEKFQEMLLAISKNKKIDWYDLHSKYVRLISSWQNMGQSLPDKLSEAMKPSTREWNTVNAALYDLQWRDDTFKGGLRAYEKGWEAKPDSDADPDVDVPAASGAPSARRSGGGSRR
ncbi:MAG: hypothetical protein C5B49_14725 [Bdellovibrio sp.]|nr:MAG: hypothetical protein C5B49_14725 [Bdellovibrio sp.]